MIKRLYTIARGNLAGWARRRKRQAEPDFDFGDQACSADEPAREAQSLHPLSGYYANLELPPGAGRGQVKQAWRRLLKKYHPDLHSTHPEKRKIATELTGRLNEAYRVLDKEFSKKG